MVIFNSDNDDQVIENERENNSAFISERHHKNSADLNYQPNYEVIVVNIQRTRTENDHIFDCYNQLLKISVLLIFTKPVNVTMSTIIYKITKMVTRRMPVMSKITAVNLESSVVLKF